jgi:beta-glucosidase
LTVTFPRAVGQVPAYYYHKPSARRGYLFSDNSPLFPFGHGLSYTSFAYRNLTVTPSTILPGGTASVRVEVTNTGGRNGDEIVQLYIRDRASSVTRPVKELKGFERISLSPGQTKTVEFKITPDLLAFYDMHMERIVEPGFFDIMVGRGSADVQTVELQVGE